MTGRTPFDLLIELIAQLRDPMTGCPWDRAQDHRSLRPYMLEEAYEAIAAIDSQDDQALCDELGDVLLQVVLHAQIAAEDDRFDIHDVVRTLSEKLIRRHPHVFGTASVDAEAIRARWDEIKRRENRPSHPVPPLVEARRLMDAGRLSLEDRSAVEADAEVAAGILILRAVKTCWEDGHEPEIALRNALNAVKDSSSGAGSGS